MYLAELMREQKDLERKIGELRDLSRVSLKKEADLDQAILKMYALLDKQQNNRIVINNILNEVKLKVGDSDISMFNAMILRDTIKKKIDAVTLLVGKDNDLDLFKLLEDRDSLENDYNKLNDQIDSNLWRVTLS